MNTILAEIKVHESGLDNVQKQLQSFLTRIKKKTGIPGICLALNIGGEYIEASVGTHAIDNSIALNSESRFQLGCITKVLTAMLTAELIENGKLDVEPIENYLEELRGTVRGKSLTIWHLLSHTSGYRGVNIVDPGIAYYYSWPQFIKYLETTPQLFKSGSVFSYEHTEYVILGEIIKRVTGRNIIDLYNEMIIDPLKITTGNIRSDLKQNNVCVGDHSFNPQSWEFSRIKPVPYGDFWTSSLSDLTMSIRDLLNLASSICGINTVHEGISSKAMSYVQKQVVTLPRTYGSTQHEQIPNTFGFGCAGYRGWILGHNGSARGQTCGLRFDPRNMIAMVVGMNAWQPFLRDTIINHVFNSLRKKSISPFPDKPLEASLNDLVGSYMGPQGQEIIVSMDGEKITCELKIPGAPTTIVIMEKDKGGSLKVCSDTLHYSLGFFKEPDSDVTGMMLGLIAFRKQ